MLTRPITDAALRRVAAGFHLLGDYAGAKAFIAKYGEVPADLTKALAGLTGVPTDLKPSFTIERQMQGW